MSQKGLPDFQIHDTIPLGTRKSVKEKGGETDARQEAFRLQREDDRGGPGGSQRPQGGEEDELGRADHPGRQLRVRGQRPDAPQGREAHQGREEGRSTQSKEGQGREEDQGRGRPGQIDEQDGKETLGLFSRNGCNRAKKIGSGGWI